MELALGIALAAFVSSAILNVAALLTDMRQWRALRFIQDVLKEEIAEWKGHGTIGEQFGNWLLNREAPDKPSNLEVISSMAGQSMFKSASMSVAGERSGDVRHQRMVEEKVLSYMSNDSPELKLAASIAEKIGLDKSDVASVLQVLGKHGGMLSGAQKNNGEGSW